MSDYWSGIFLLGTILVGLFLGVIAISLLLLGKKHPNFIKVSICIVVILMLAWVSDRFLVGTFCFPWECVDRGVDLETLLLNDDSFSGDWSVAWTIDYAYVPRSSFAYRERTFHRTSAYNNNAFYEEIYQYKSIRGAAFQFNLLRKDLPHYYSVHSIQLTPHFTIQVGHASEFDVGCVYDMKNTLCYYIGRYVEYILVLEMPFSGDQILEKNFTQVVDLANERFSNELYKIVTP